jgi:hypothetical protein
MIWTPKKPIDIGAVTIDTCFAFWPVKLSDGRKVWLGWYKIRYYYTKLGWANCATYVGDYEDYLNYLKGKR